MERDLVPQRHTVVVVPTYQEADNVLVVLDRLRAAVPQAQVLIVDDASPDGTADLAARAAATDPAIHVLRRGRKDGLGAAYRAGFAWARAAEFEVVVQMDADLSHDPADVARLLAAVDDGADLAIGSRYVPGGSIPDWPRHRRLLSRAGNHYAGAMLRLGVRDATGGFRAWRVGLLDAIDLTTVNSDGYGFMVEMTYRAVALGATIRELPITFADRARGASKMSSAIIFEALALVTRWGVRDRVARSRRTPRPVLAPAAAGPDLVIDLTEAGRAAHLADGGPAAAMAPPSSR